MADADEQEEEEILLQPDELFDGRYRIEKILGRGGIGIVYKAEDTENHISVALKVLNSDWAKNRKMVTRFLREARLAIRVQHSSIVQILASGKSKKDGAAYLVMEFIEGKTLHEYLQPFLKRGQKIGVAAAAPIMRQIASVLAACHARGVVHRDLKPANIMLLDDEEAIGGKRIKLLDFGIAKMFTEDTQTGAQTSVGEQQPGTPAYMAPEQCSGTLGPDADPAKMDTYACGVIFYQLLGGRLPLWSPNCCAARWIG